MFAVACAFSELEINVCEGVGNISVCVEITGESVDSAMFSISTTETGTASGIMFLNIIILN